MILEVYCLHNLGDKEDDPIPEFCTDGPLNIKIHCIQNSCKFLGAAPAPNEIAFADNDGIVPTSDHWIGFGGDMEEKGSLNNEARLKIWENICIRKINEAYDEYMTQIIMDNKTNATDADRG